MSTHTMRWLDHWLGLPICCMTGLIRSTWRRISPSRQREIVGGRPILVMKFFGLGTILQASILLRAMRDGLPANRLIFLTFSSNAPLLRTLNLCSEIRVIRTDSLFGFATSTLREVVWLWRQRVIAVVDLEFFSKFSTLMSVLSGASTRIGYHLNDFWRYSLLTHPVYFNYYHHISDIYAQIARRLGIGLDEKTLPAIVTDPAAVERADDSLRKLGWQPSQPIIGVNINAGDMSLERRWPPENFKILIENLLNRHADLRIVLTGSRSEQPYVESLHAMFPEPLRERILVCAGRWSLEELIAGMGRMSVFVTNDSGPMHLAAALRLPMVSLWGPGRPEFFAPAYQDHITIYRNYPCSPCLYMFTTFEGMWCNHEGWCMHEIQPDAVMESVERLLKTGSRATGQTA